MGLGISGVTATAGEQIGYSFADVVAKAVFGVLIWAIAAEKSKLEEEGGLLAWSVVVAFHVRARSESRVIVPKAHRTVHTRIRALQKELKNWGSLAVQLTYATCTTAAE